MHTSVIVFVFYGKKMKCIRILGHKWIHMVSDLLVLIDDPIYLSFHWIHRFLQFDKICISVPVFLMYLYLAAQKLKVFGSMEISTSAKCIYSLGEVHCITRFGIHTGWKIIMESATKSCVLDPMPTSILKQCWILYFQCSPL